eukprot:4499439-Lingulodinium_polyedra.AAC.1
MVEECLPAAGSKEDPQPRATWGSRAAARMLLPFCQQAVRASSTARPGGRPPRGPEDRGANEELSPSQPAPPRGPRPCVHIALFSGTHCNRHAVKAEMWRSAKWTVLAECHPETRQARQARFGYIDDGSHQMRRAPGGMLYVAAKDVNDLLRRDRYIVRHIFLPRTGSRPQTNPCRSSSRSVPPAKT